METKSKEKILEKVQDTPVETTTEEETVDENEELLSEENR